MNTVLRINESESADSIASFIFNNFILNQSCSIKGFETVGGKIKVKGMLVVNRLVDLDIAKNTRNVNGKSKRIRYRPDNCVGGEIAHKTFRFKLKTLDGIPVVTIWRIQ